MTTTLSEGVKVPDVGSVNWAGDLEVNWNLLNGALANLSGNVKLDRDNTWTGEQSFTLPIVGSITGTASKAIADEDGTSIKTGYVNVAGNQTVTGDKTWTGVNNVTNSDFNFSQNFILGDGSFHLSRLQFYDSSATRWGVLAYRHNTDNSTEAQIGLYSLKSDNATTSQFITFLLANNGDAELRPFFTDKKISLGASTNQWKSVYAQTYYYNGTAWGLDKANTWTNVNTFNGSTNTVVNLQRGGSSYYSDIRFADETSHILGCIRASTELQIGCQRSSNWADGSQIILKNNGSLQFVLNDGTNTTNIIVNATEIKPTTSVTDLGTSTNKWKSLNGINPGALSLPDYDSTAKIDISGSIIPDQYNNIYYTPTINGWLYVCFDISSATTNDPIFYIQAKDNNVANSSFVQTSWMLASSGTSSLAIFFPVVANKQFVMQINFSNYTIIKAHVIPCLGNV